MLFCFGELRSKEIICLKTGERLGFADDIEFDSETMSIASLIIYGQKRFFGFFGRDDDIIVPFESIKLIGKDTILVSFDEKAEKPTKRLAFKIQNLYK